MTRCQQLTPVCCTQYAVRSAYRIVSYNAVLTLRPFVSVSAVELMSCQLPNFPVVLRFV
jgi:hypothetical protein